MNRRPGRRGGRLELWIGLVAGVALAASCSGVVPGEPQVRVSGRPECRVEKIELSAEDDPQQKHLFALSSQWSIPVLAAQALSYTWSVGQGLEVSASEPGAWIELAAPLALSDERYPDLLLRYTADSRQRLVVQWIDDECSDYASTCSTELLLQGGSSMASRVSLSGRRAGSLERIRLGFDPGAQLIIHSMRAAGAELPGPDVWLELIGEAEVLEPVSTHDARSTLISGKGIEISPDSGESLDIHLNFQAQINAEVHQVMRVRTSGGGITYAEAFWSNAVCGEPRFHPGCRMTAARTDEPGLWEIRLHEHPYWRGEVEHFRLDFDAPQPELFRITGLELRPASAASLSTGETDALEHASPRTSRRPRRLVDGGPLVWRLDAGERLLADLPDHLETPGLAMESISYRVPAAMAGVQLFELSGSWEMIDGSLVSAFVKVGSFWRRESSPWIEVPLEQPEMPPRRLIVELVCGPNCSSYDEPGRYLEIAQPIFTHAPVTAGLPRQDLIVLMIDTLRADHLTTYGYEKSTDPFLASLSRRAVVYDRAYAVDTWTNPTHASLFTGRYPYYAGSSHFQAVGMQGRTLAEALSAEGFYTLARTDGGQLRIGLGFDRGFDSYSADFEPLRSRLESALTEIEALRSGRRRFFAFLHTYAVHEPYSLSRSQLDDLQSRPDEVRGIPFSSASLVKASELISAHPRPDAVAEFLNGQYDLEIRAMDEELRRFFGEVERRGWLEDSVVVITSDHGEEILEHGRLGHGAQLPFSELTHVPLLILDPDERAGARVDELMPQVRVANMLLERLGSAQRLGGGDELAGTAASIVTSKNLDLYPTTEFLSVVVRDQSCGLLEVSHRWTGQVIESRLIEGDQAMCGASADLFQQSLATIKQRFAEIGAFNLVQAGSAGRSPSGRQPLVSGEAQPIDAHDLDQLEALGYLSD